MLRISTSRIALIGVIILAIMATGWVFHRGGPLSMITDISGKVLTPVTYSVNSLGAFIEIFVSRGDLVSENVRLREQVQSAQAAAAQVDNLQQENAFLRSAQGIRERLLHAPIQGAVFSYLREGGVREMVINRGSADQIVVGDAVITAQGALVGIIINVSDHHAIVRSFGDPSFEAAARIVDGEVTGLIRTDPTQGTVLDLVQKSETVTEGQFVETSGNDQYPAGILMGTVKSVDNDSATLFKIVRIAPAISDTLDGRVLIIQP